MDDRVVSVGCPWSDRRCGGRRGAGRPRGRRTPGLARRWLWRNAPQKPPGPMFAGWSYGWPSPRGRVARSGHGARRPNAPRGLRQDEGALSVGASRVQGCVMWAGHCRRCQPSPLCLALMDQGHTRVGKGEQTAACVSGTLCPPASSTSPRSACHASVPSGAAKQHGALLAELAKARRGGKDRDTPRDSGRPARRPKDGDTHGQTRDGRRLFPARATRRKHVPHSSIIPSARLSFPGFLITRRDRLFSGSCDHA